MFDKWINKGLSFDEKDGVISFRAGEKSDFFVDPSSSLIAKNAPVYAKEVENDFTVTCKIKPEFGATFDAGTIMLYQTDTNWVKLAFEKTDIGHNAVVSVVTQDVSDDANGELITSKSVWLRMTRKGNMIGLYYSDEGVNLKMVRLFRFSIDEAVISYLGVSAQSPIGNGCTVVFTDYMFENTAVADLRRGV